MTIKPVRVGFDVKFSVLPKADCSTRPYDYLVNSNGFDIKNVSL
jgi:hypothetical protein